MDIQKIDKLAALSVIVDDKNIDILKSEIRDSKEIKIAFELVVLYYHARINSRINVTNKMERMNLQVAIDVLAWILCKEDSKKTDDWFSLLLDNAIKGLENDIDRGLVNASKEATENKSK